jgi:glutaredoxin
MISRIFLLVLLIFAGLAHAQQYRWVDKDGRVQYTDAPPPAWAKDVRKTTAATAAAEPGPAAPALPFELARLQKDLPVTFYSAPGCKEVCEQVRTALNKRGVPFKEIQVWNRETNEELQKVSGGTNVPTILVGQSVQRGFYPDALDALLDSAGYPKAGAMPVRSQKAPDLPAGYVPPGGSDAVAKSAARSEKAEVPQKAGPYDPSRLQGVPQRSGPYSVPAETK